MCSLQSLLSNVVFTLVSHYMLLSLRFGYLIFSPYFFASKNEFSLENAATIFQATFQKVIIRSQKSKRLFLRSKD